MENKNKRSFLSPFFSFHFVTVFGILIAFFVYMLSNNNRPLASFIFSRNLYILSSLIAIATRLLLWVLVDKGTFFEIKRVIGRIIQDVIIINVVILSTLGSIFIIETFFL